MQSLQQLTIAGDNIAMRIVETGVYHPVGSEPQVWVKKDEASNLPCHIRILRPYLQGYREELWLVPPNIKSIPPQIGEDDESVTARFIQEDESIQISHTSWDGNLLVQEDLGRDFTELPGVAEFAWAKPFLVRVPGKQFHLLLPGGSKASFVSSRGRLRIRWVAD